MLEKAIADKKAPGTVARLAKQAAQFYRECAALLAAPPLNQVRARGRRAQAGVVLAWGWLSGCGAGGGAGLAAGTSS